MSGPSRRTMVAAAVAIAVAGIGVGAVIGWRALAKPVASAAPVPQTSVLLIDNPELLPRADASAGAVADAALSPVNPTTGRGSRVATRGGHTSGTRAGQPSDDDTAHTTGSSRTANSGSTSTDGTSAPANRNGHATGATGTHTTQASAAGTIPSNDGTGTTGSTTHTNPSGSSSDSTNAATQLALNDIATGGTHGTPLGPSQSGYYQAGEVTDATGTMDPAVFQFVYRHYQSQIAACHSMAGHGNSLPGAMRLRVRLGTDGHVVRTHVVDDTTHSQELETCVQNSIRSWRYPQPEGGEVEFEYNFGFGS